MANKADYDAYLTSHGYSEKEVLAMIRHAELTDQDIIGIGSVISTMAQLIEQGNENSPYAMNILQSLSSNTNWLLQEVIDGRLKKRFQETGVYYRPDIFAGVFPTNDFNARAIKKTPGLILIDTASFELIETVCSVYMTDAPQNARVLHFSKIITRFLAERTLPHASELDHPSLRGSQSQSRRIYITELTTAAEEFILAHEYGHLTLDHYDAHNGEQLKMSRKDIEFDADQWAVEVLIKTNSLWYDEGLEVQLGGLFIPLGIQLIIEIYNEAKKNKRLESDYPSAEERIQRIWRLLERCILQEKMVIARSILSFLVVVADYIRRS